MVAFKKVMKAAGMITLCIAIFEKSIAFAVGAVLTTAIALALEIILWRK